MDKIIKILLVILLLSMNLPAQVREYHGFRYKLSPDLDGWSVVHFVEGIGLYQFYHSFIKSEKTSLGFAIFTGYFYEFIMDGYGNELFGIHSDPGGADLIGDPLFTAIGAWMNYHFTRERKVRIYLSKQKITFRISINILHNS